jgi:hypothetical protein
MTYNLFLAILLIRAFISSGEQTFLSQPDESLPEPMELLDTKETTLQSSQECTRPHQDATYIGEFTDWLTCGSGDTACGLGLYAQLNQGAGTYLDDSSTIFIYLECCNNKNWSIKKSLDDKDHPDRNYSRGYPGIKHYLKECPQDQYISDIKFRLNHI